MLANAFKTPGRRVFQKSIAILRVRHVGNVQWGQTPLLHCPSLSHRRKIDEWKKDSGSREYVIKIDLCASLTGASAVPNAPYGVHRRGSGLEHGAQRVPNQ